MNKLHSHKSIVLILLAAVMIAAAGWLILIINEKMVRVLQENELTAGDSELYEISIEKAVCSKDTIRISGCVTRGNDAGAAEIHAVVKGNNGFIYILPTYVYGREEGEMDEYTLLTYDENSFRAEMPRKGKLKNIHSSDEICLYTDFDGRLEIVHTGVYLQEEEK